MYISQEILKLLFGRSHIADQPISRLNQSNKPLMDKLISVVVFNVPSAEMEIWLTEHIYKLPFQKLINLWVTLLSLLEQVQVFMHVG